MRQFELLAETAYAWLMRDTKGLPVPGTSSRVIAQQDAAAEGQAVFELHPGSGESMITTVQVLEQRPDDQRGLRAAPQRDCIGDLPTPTPARGGRTVPLASLGLAVDVFAMVGVNDPDGPRRVVRVVHQPVAARPDPPQLVTAPLHLN